MSRKRIATEVKSSRHFVQNVYLYLHVKFIGTLLPNSSCLFHVVKTRANKGLFSLNLCSYVSYTFFIIPILTIVTNNYFSILKIYKYLEKIDVHCFWCASKFRIESNTGVFSERSASTRNGDEFSNFVVKLLFAFVNVIGPLTKKVALLCSQLAFWLVIFVQGVPVRVAAL